MRPLARVSATFIDFGPNKPRIYLSSRVTWFRVPINCYEVATPTSSSCPRRAFRKRENEEEEEEEEEEEREPEKKVCSSLQCFLSLSLFSVLFGHWATTTVLDALLA